MKRTPIASDLSGYPVRFHSLLKGAALYDSSCSAEARVTFVDREDGLFLKSGPKGSLAGEAAMDRFFFEKGLGPEVLEYATLDQDWLLTRKVRGEDCLHEAYLSDPKRLCDTTAELLRMLHDTSPEGCPVNQTETRIARARQNYAAGNYDCSLFPDNWGYATAEEA